MSQPGLLEISERMPSVLVKLAPQLAIAGFGGPLEPAIARVYGSSVEAYELKRSNGEKGGSGLTTSELCPSCDEDFALRHPTFGDYRPSLVACGFVQGHGYMGPSPNVKAYDAIDYLVWMLSTRSEWLPPSTHAYLLRGMKEWAVWPWWGKSHNSEYVGSNDGALCSLIHEALASSRRKITLTKEAESDLHDRIAYTREILDLPECSSELVARFMGEQVIESWFLAQKELKRRRKFK